MEVGMLLLIRSSAACRSELSGTVGPGQRGSAGPANAAEPVKDISEAVSRRVGTGEKESRIAGRIDQES